MSTTTSLIEKFQEPAVVLELNKLGVFNISDIKYLEKKEIEELDISIVAKRKILETHKKIKNTEQTIIISTSTPTDSFSYSTSTATHSNDDGYSCSTAINPYAITTSLEEEAWDYGWEKLVR